MVWKFVDIYCETQTQHTNTWRREYTEYLSVTAVGMHIYYRTLNC